MIELCYGKDTLGIFDTVELAVDYASVLMYRQGIHHEFDWPQIRYQSSKVSENLSISISGFNFHFINLKEWPNFDLFQKASLDMADETQNLRLQYGPDGEHPEFQRDDWRSAVAFNETQLGYWEWVVHQVQANQ